MRPSWPASYRWPPGRSWAFGLGVATLVVATQSGLGRYDTALFSLHMVQHLLLSFVVVPMFLLGHSLGGLIALRYQEEYNSRFDGAIIVSPDRLAAMGSAAAERGRPDAVHRIAERLLTLVD